MSYDRYQYKIICEDRNHYNFVRGLLIKKGADCRKINSFGELPHPGSGKEYVRANSKKAVEDVRRRSARAQTVLILVMDADELTFCDALRSIPANEIIKDDDPVFIAIPRWSIESWARWLLEPNHEKARDESVSCKKERSSVSNSNYCNSKFTELGKQLASHINSPDDQAIQGMPDSLSQTIKRMKKRISCLQNKN